MQDSGFGRFFFLSRRCRFFAQSFLRLLNGRALPGRIAQEGHTMAGFLLVMTSNCWKGKLQVHNWERIKTGQWRSKWGFVRWVSCVDELLVLWWTKSWALELSLEDQKPWRFSKPANLSTWSSDIRIQQLKTFSRHLLSPKKCHLNTITAAKDDD